MKIENRSKISTIILILVLAIFAMLSALPIISAQDLPKRVTYAFIGAVPNPVGINQEVLLHIGISEQRSSVEQGWEGLSVTATDPNGDTYTLFENIKTDSTGGTGRVFVPTMVGIWYLQTHFPEQTVLVIPPLGQPIPPYNQTYAASDSELLELVVQADPLEYYPGSPLPSEYWTRPIDAQHREWNTIAGNWVEIPPNRYAPFNDNAPESAHILWTKPLEMGGLVGGNLGNHAFVDGDAYQGRWGASVIIGGILYYNRYWGGLVGGPPQGGIIAVDLRTGQELWFKNNTRLAFGQTLYFSSQNQHSSYDYIWETVGNTWKAYDGFTGEWVYTMENVPSGIRTRGPNGEILIYIVDTNNSWMALWNSTAVENAPAPPGPPGIEFIADNWEPEGLTYDASAPYAYSWNVTIPTDLPGTARMAFVGNKIIGSNVPEGSFGLPATDPITSWGLSLQPGHEGTLLFTNTWQPPAGNIHLIWATASSEDDVFLYAGKETRAIYGFSMVNGSYLYTTESHPYLDFYTFGETRAIPRAIVIADGRIFSVGVAGILYCSDVETGDTLWTYEATDQYSEILWANDWWLNIMFVTDGKIYLGHDEHSPIDPKPRGAPFVAIDIETGKEVWKIDGAFRQTQWGGSAVIGDSIIATMNTYDQRIYAIGKGPSATTVSAAPKVVTQGSSIVIEGMVTDISPGTNDPDLAMRFPAGVPAIADEDMSEWMKYVYMQFPRPDVAGVTVTLDAVDPTGEFISIGSATSDSSGFYSYRWTPETEGKYTIIASFMGSKAYWPSYLETAISVDPVIPGGPIETEEPGPLVTTEVAIIIAVVVIAGIGIVAYWVIRKRD